MDEYWSFWKILWKYVGLFRPAIKHLCFERNLNKPYEALPDLVGDVDRTEIISDDMPKIEARLNFRIKIVGGYNSEYKTIMEIDITYDRDQKKYKEYTEERSKNFKNSGYYFTPCTKSQIGCYFTLDTSKYFFIYDLDKNKFSGKVYKDYDNPDNPNKEKQKEEQRQLFIDGWISNITLIRKLTLSGPKSISISLDEIKKIFGDYVNNYVELYNILSNNDKQLFSLNKFQNFASFIRFKIHSVLSTVNIFNFIDNKITKEEFEIMEKCKGQLVKMESDEFMKRNKDKLIHYDQTSSFPYMFCRNDIDVANDSKNFLFSPDTLDKLDILWVPLKQCSIYDWDKDKKYTLDKLTEFLKREIGRHKLRYGIYNVKISNVPEKYQKIFKINNENYYTHFDLYCAYDCGATIELLSPKVMYWNKHTKPNEPKELYPSCYLFGWYLRNTFKLRMEHKNNPLFKPLISQFHGALFEKDFYDKYQPNTEPIEEELYENFQIYYFVRDRTGKIKDINNFTRRLQYISSEYYKSPFARVKPFLYSYQRYFFFYCVFKPLIDNGYKIYHILTDGFYTDKPIPQFDKNTEKKLGVILRDEK